MTVQIKITADEDFFVPEKQTEFSAGYDLKAAVEDDVKIAPGKRKLISSGIKLEIPSGFEGQVRPRSGLSIKHGITLLNSPGTIDADYRGDVGVILYNAGEEEFIIRRGDRIAQIIFAPVQSVSFQMSMKLESSNRGTGGFGSTGV